MYVGEYWLLVLVVDDEPDGVDGVFFDGLAEQVVCFFAGFFPDDLVQGSFLFQVNVEELTLPCQVWLVGVVGGV